MKLGIIIEIRITGDGLNPRSLAAVEAALKRATFKAAQFAKGLWIRRAQQLDIRQTGAYIRGIQEGRLDQVHAGSSGDIYDVHIDVVNTAPHASVVEDGHSAFHLPSRIDWSGPNVKRGPNGPYLNIPFTHRAYQSQGQRERSGMTSASIKQMMPRHIHQAAKQLPYHRPGQAGNRRLSRTTSPSIVMGSHADRSFVEHRSERFVGRSKSGAKLTNPAWKGSKFDGLMKTGRRKQTRYMTIRTITPRSQGWNIPAMHGRGVARQVAYSLTHGSGRRMVGEIIERAIFEAAGEEFHQ